MNKKHRNLNFLAIISAVAIVVVTTVVAIVVIDKEKREVAEQESTQELKQEKIIDGSETLVTPSPIAVSSPNTQPSQKVVPQEVKTTCPVTSDEYATVIDFRDSLGNVYKQSQYNQCNSSNGGYYTVKKGEAVTISVNADAGNSSALKYQFVGSGFPNEWQSSNSVTVTFDDQYLQRHLRVFVKNEDSSFRAPDYDDMIQVFYTVTD